MKCVVCRLLSVSLTLLLATIFLNAQNMMNHVYPKANTGDINRGDFNGDGIPDVIFVTFDGMEVGLSNSQGGLTFLSTSGSAQGDRGETAIAKFTSSHHLDAALLKTNVGVSANSIEIFLGNGDGTFEIGQPVMLPTGVNAGSITAGDFNGDGKIDLAVASGKMVYIFPGHGDGTFAAAKLVPISSPSASFSPFKLRVGDFDGDGRPDLMFSDSFQGSVLFNTGNFTFQQKNVTNENPFLLDFAAVDVNQDGFTDFIVTLQGDCPPNNSPCNGGYAVYLSQGSSRTFKLSYRLTPTFRVFPPQHPSVADVDGDGINDFVFLTHHFVPILHVAKGNPDGTFQMPMGFILGDFNGGAAFAAVDLNRDGRPDFVTTNPTLEEVYTSLNAFPRSPCTASTMSPSVTVCQPSADTYSNSPLHVVAKATDTAHPITAMQIYVDGQLKSTTKAVNLDTTVALPTGDHVLSVKAGDASGKLFRSVRRITIYSGTPGRVCSTASDTIHLCAPAQNANVKSPVRVFAASGTTSEPDAMQVYIDHQLVFTDDTTDNFIDHRFTLTPGTHSLTVKGWATSGQQLSQSEIIHVTQ